VSDPLVAKEVSDHFELTSSHFSVKFRLILSLTTRSQNKTAGSFTGHLLARDEQRVWQRKNLAKPYANFICFCLSLEPMGNFVEKTLAFNITKDPVNCLQS